ncbi:MAG: SH3 domain-containing protein [Anaerolineae bacterium]
MSSSHPFQRPSSSPKAGEPAGAPTGKGRRLDINELPVWTWILILLPVVLIGGALWAMTRSESGPEPLSPTATPTPAPAPAAAFTPMVIVATPPPPPLSAGMTAEVFGTGADQLRVRSGPGTTYATLQIVADGTRVQVLEGPSPADGFQWWQVQLSDGTIGWVVGDFLRTVP